MNSKMKNLYSHPYAPLWSSTHIHHTRPVPQMDMLNLSIFLQ
ncbi:hypothetical protein EhV156_00307 [Emiliania huxleyi virus 156]|nr:hypothetical protein EhV156_00307 [Emiliania huxleyi virus 156]